MDGNERKDDSSQGLPWLAMTVVAVAAIAGFLLCFDARTRSLVANTVLLGLGTCAVGLPVSVLLAVLLVRTDVPGRRAATGAKASVFRSPPV